MNIEDFVRIEKQDGVATLWIDNKKEKMNVVSPDLIGIFEKVFNDLDADKSVEAVVIISAKPDFIAGADIKSFSIEKKGDFRPFQSRGHEALNKLENSSKPIVAAIHGTCYGLGTEMALACTARIASDDSRTKFALPEVKLGLLPGGGGTQRLPRLVGLQKSLDMMLTGKNIYPYQAKKMGLIDELTDKNKLHQAAVIFAKRLIKKPIQRKIKKSLLNKFLDGTSMGRNLVFKQAKKLADKNAHGNYPAIPAIFDCVETGLKKGLKAGYEKELDLFEDLMLTPESAALRQLFFGMTDNKKNPVGDDAKKLETLGMLGAGFMGAGITEVSVNKGIDVLLKDIKAETLQEAKQQIWKSLTKKLKRKMIAKPQAEEIMGRVSTSLDYDSFEHADIVIEAVVEIMDLKKKIITEIEQHCKDDVIIATNTSSLSVTEMAEHSTKPEQVIGMHYFSPVPKMPLLEIVKTEHTADWVTAACYDFGLKQGKTCIVVNDGPGFYVNRILAPYINECLIMGEEGVALDAIDRALNKKGFPVGPIKLLDEVGLDIGAHSIKSNEKVAATRPGVKLSYAVVKMFEAGRLGRKNKQGFFLYDQKTGKRKGLDASVYQFFEGNGTVALDAEMIQNRAIMLMLKEAVLCLEDNIIANPADGDLGAVFGIGFLPYTGGPFRYMDLLGIQNVVDTMYALHQKYGERFAPPKTLVDMAANEQRFHE